MKSSFTLFGSLLCYCLKTGRHLRGKNTEGMTETKKECKEKKWIKLQNKDYKHPKKKFLSTSHVDVGRRLCDVDLALQTLTLPC
jgi:hypothetical protein